MPAYTNYIQTIYEPYTNHGDSTDMVLIYKGLYSNKNRSIFIAFF